MAKKKKNSEKKRRWYHAYVDAYTVSARTYPWVGWAMGGIVLVTMGVAITLGVVRGPLVWSLVSGVLFSVMLVLLLLALLVRPATYKQLDGTPGAVYSVVGQTRGWTIDEMPAQITKDGVIVWRLIGRPGVVLISEGPPSRALPLLQTERRKVGRVIGEVPVIIIQSGHDQGQVPLGKLPGRLRGLKRKLTKQQVPEVANRLAAVGAKTTQIPRGVDPKNPRMNRRALRG